MRLPVFTLITTIIALLWSCTTTDQLAQDCTGTTSMFSIDLDPAGCSQDLAISNAFSTTVNVPGDFRAFVTNCIPDHPVGTFPNGGNPNTISAQSKTYEVDLTPSVNASPISITDQLTGLPFYEFGILLSGVTVDPMAAEYWRNPSSGQLNRSWNYEALSSGINLGTDCNNAHVQPNGKYHYHGTPSAYIESLNITGTEMVLIGYAADGFPVYYKYAYSDAANSSSTVTEMHPGYQLKTTERNGNGVSAPNGCPDGTFVQDYEFVNGLGDLDQCNGRTGVTPEFPSGTYYYVITDDWPSVPRCFMGTPDNSFKIF